MPQPTADDSGRWETLRTDFSPNRLLGTVLTGAVLAMVNALLTIALMSLIFQGDIRELLPLGLGLGLVASAVMAAVIAVGSGFAGAYAGVQDSSAAILGLAAASVAVSVTQPQTADSVVAMMMVTSLATGVLLLAMGRFRLGDIARFVPFPVIGGLLAGTGYLIVVGSVDILGGLSAATLTGATGLAVFWPGLALAVAFLVSSRLGWAARNYLVFLVIAIAGFHLVLASRGLSIDSAASDGWLLGPFPEGSLWPGFALGSLVDANWGTIATEAASLATILIVVPMTVLLYTSALEVETRRDLDAGVELRVTGWANVAGGLLGGPPGYLYLADSLITRRLLGGRRGPAVVAAAGVALIMLAGGELLGLLPQYVIGGLLLFVGLEFLTEWLWDARRRMGRLDYLLMAGIVVIIATVGFLPGVGAGLLAAIVLFVIRYSQVDVVKHSMTIQEHRSNIERAPAETAHLETVGDRAVILELQGFIFFGTGHRITAHVKSLIYGESPIEFVVSDLRMVTGIDSSAVILFERLALLGEEHGFVLVLTGVSDDTRHQFDGLVAGFPDAVHLESDLDHGVAWCEEQLIAGAGTALAARSRALPAALTDRLDRYMRSITVEEGKLLMTQGDEAPGLYLIVSGRATVQLEAEEGPPVRLRTLLEGTLIGEISLYRGEPVTASVVTDTECRLLHLSPASFKEMCENDPVLAADFHAFVARTLAGRVSYANRTIRALHR